MLDVLEYVIFVIVLFIAWWYFFSILAIVFLVSAFSTLPVSLYKWHTYLKQACRRLVLWIVVLVGIYSGAGIKGLLYGVPGDTYS